jgi:mono/diheme cytochrome c family protein
MRRAWMLIPAGLLGAGAAIAVWFFLRGSNSVFADPDNASQVALGARVYEAQCGRCHGDKLEGESNWMQRKPSGRLPAPPHDASGHTWHHSDSQLFGIVKNGLTPYVPEGYQSDMPAFGGTLSDDEIWGVLAYIKSAWPQDIRERQREISLRAK